ncbi:winged helix-turn-helix transcriptional regulator [Kineococcus sp. SYSU DK001]|uniref:winged helix-turn-helix transcriptional regulator n=1 Tax=Kineococcus sp. SYSU DK001 TaxID=3383122 RepID=UPI003D7DAFE1
MSSTDPPVPGPPPVADPGRPRTCSIARTLELVGEKWSLLAVREVFYGVHRFDRIVANTGAPRDVMTTRLRRLVEAGVLVRVPYSQRPPRWEYRLTDAGRDLLPVLMALMSWGDEHLAADGPPVVWGHACGHDLAPQTVCRSCGEPVRGEGLELRRTSEAP